MIIQEEEQKEIKEEKDQVMGAAAANVAAAEVRRANQLIYDQISALETLPVIQVPVMTGRRISEGLLENSTTI